MAVGLLIGRITIHIRPVGFLLVCPPAAFHLYPFPRICSSRITYKDQGTQRASRHKAEVEMNTNARTRSRISRAATGFMDAAMLLPQDTVMGTR